MSNKIDHQKAFDFVQKTLDEMIDLTDGNAAVSLLICETIVATILRSVTPEPARLDDNLGIFAKNVKAHISNLQMMESANGKV